MKLRWLRYLLLAVLIFGSSILSRAQNDSLFQVLSVIQYPTTSFEVGTLGELYIIDANNQLKKLNEKGDSVGVFNQVTKYGKLSYVVAQNPWKTLLFYKDFSTILLADKFLKIIGTINLRSRNIEGVKAITTSYDNHIWLFDEKDYKLKKIDDNGNTLMETVDFRSLFNDVPTPQEMKDHNGYVYLMDPEKGIYIFDYYGSYKTKFSSGGWNTFAAIGKAVYGFDKTTVYKYTPPLPVAETFFLPAPIQHYDEIKLMNRKLYVLKDGQLSVYFPSFEAK